jgi:hypothetical protein
MDENNKQQLEALNVLINGIKMAQKRGAYELPEAEVLWKAIKVFLVTNNENNSNTRTDDNTIGFNNELN